MAIELTRVGRTDVLSGDMLTLTIYLPIIVFIVLLLVILIVSASGCVSEILLHSYIMYSSLMHSISLKGFSLQTQI